MATKQIALRVDDALLDRLDRMIAALKKDPEYRVMDINRSVAIRMMVERGLLAWELRLGLENEDWYKLDEATNKFWGRRLAEWNSEFRQVMRVQQEWFERATEAGLLEEPEDDEPRGELHDLAKSLAEAKRTKG
jgi:hypothetical protein